MISMLLALAWEFWQRQRWRIVLCVLGAFGFCALFFHGMKSADNPRDLDEVVLDIIGIISIPQVLAFVALILHGQCDVQGRHTGFIARLYTLPLSTRWLVGTQMALGAGSVFLMTVATTLAFSRYSGVPLNPWCAGLIMAAIMAWSQVVIWVLPDFQFLRVAALALVGSVVVYAATRVLSHDYETIWSGAPLIAYICSLVLIGAALEIAVWGVARERRGDAQGWVALRAAWGRWIARRPMRTKPFTSPTRALFWGECRQKLYIMPLVVGLFELFFLLLGVVGILRPRDLLVAMTGISIAGSFLGSFVFGIIFGRSGHFGRHTRIDTFTATLPVPDRQLSTAVLKTGLTSLLLTWVICIATFGLTSYALMALGHTKTVNDVWREISGNQMSLHEMIICGLGWLSLPWTLLGLSISLSLTGREKFLGFFSLGIVLLFFGVPMLAALTEETVVKRCLGVLFALFVIGGLGGTFWAYVAARRRRYIGAWLAWGALGLWVGLLVMVQTWPYPNFQPHSKQAVSILTYGALVLAPLATAPLALSWNRHR